MTSSYYSQSRTVGQNSNFDHQVAAILMAIPMLVSLIFDGAGQLEQRDSRDLRRMAYSHRCPAFIQVVHERE
jgi:hypothetical protein